MCRLHLCRRACTACSCSHLWARHGRHLIQAAHDGHLLEREWHCPLQRKGLGRDGRGGARTAGERAEPWSWPGRQIRGTAQSCTCHMSCDAAIDMTQVCKCTNLCTYDISHMPATIEGHWIGIGQSACVHCYTRPLHARPRTRTCSISLLMYSSWLRPKSSMVWPVDDTKTRRALDLRSRAGQESRHQAWPGRHTSYCPYSTYTS